jgi:hypothetical protein
VKQKRARLPCAYRKLTAKLPRAYDSMPDCAYISLYMMSG